MAEIDNNQVTVTFDRTEAPALLNAAEVGVRVIEALRLVQRVGPTETAVNKLRAAVSQAGLPAEPTTPSKPAAPRGRRRASGGAG
jgi:hypothetical protein